MAWVSSPHPTLPAIRGLTPWRRSPPERRLLLLLALLVVGEARVLAAALAGARRRLGDAQEFRFADRRARLAHGDAYGELALGLALVDPARGRHVGVVAAHRAGDVALAGQDVVGRIEAHPAQARQEHLDPGVGGVGIRAVAGLAVGEQVARHVAGGQAPLPADGDHHVGEVLADPLAGLQDALDPAVGAGD